MESCSSILAWEIPWAEEPGGLPSTGSQRVRCVCMCTHTRTHTHAHNDANTLPVLIFFQGTFLDLKISICDLGVPCFLS